MTPAILVLILLAIPSYAADSKTTAPKATPTQTPSQTTAQQDKFIEATIRAKLAKSKIGKDGFTVRVQGGVAYWEGTTAVPQHKGAATRMAHTSGAPNVINNIKVTQSGVAQSAARTTSPVASPAASPASSAATVSSTTSSTPVTTKRPASAPVPAMNSTTNSAVNNSPAEAPAPIATQDPGPRRVQVKPASSTNGPPQ